MLDFDPKVAHLLRRATLGPTIEEIQAASEVGLQPTLDKMLSEIDRPLSKNEAAAQAIGGVFLRDLEGLRAGWMLRMLNSPNLFREKLTVFWHGHFATAISKVNDTTLMAKQIDTLRELGLGSFKDMLLAMARDTAMLIWLDNALSVKGKPNENFARELMELFSLGIGNYSESDVKEVARAFTGWNLENKKFVFSPDKHDEEPKTILGKVGPFNGDDVIDQLSSTPASSRFICRKLWRYFVSQTPTDDDIAPMMEAYSKNDRKIAPVLKAMFSSPRFFAAENVGTQVKSPVEFVVGTIRALGADLAVNKYGDAVAAMGQDLYNPPDVSGWKGGEEWISTFTLLERIRLVRQLAGTGKSGMVCGLDVNKIVAQNFIGTNEELTDHFIGRFLHRKPPVKLRSTLIEFLAAGSHGQAAIKLPGALREEKLRGLVRLILCSPEYQLC